MPSGFGGWGADGRGPAGRAKVACRVCCSSTPNFHVRHRDRTIPDGPSQPGIAVAQARARADRSDPTGRMEALRPSSDGRKPTSESIMDAHRASEDGRSRRSAPGASPQKPSAVLPNALAQARRSRAPLSPIPGFSAPSQPDRWCFVRYNAPPTMKTPPTTKPGIASSKDVHFGLDVESIKHDFLENLFTHQAKFPEVATPNDNYLALSYTVRDRMLHRWIHTSHTYFSQSSRTVAYLSAEFLIGPQLGNNLVSLGIWEPTQQAMDALGLSLDELLEQEEEPGLGNGGLGRLAACYLDSLATLEIPATGYGIRYEFGIFDQAIKDGWQVEVLDHWLHLGYPWEIAHPEIAFKVMFGGHTEHYADSKGHLPRALDSRPSRQGLPQRHAHPRPPHQHRQHVAPVAGAGLHLARPAGLQRGRLPPRRRGKGAFGKHHQGALSQRRFRGGQALAPAATVLLHLVLAAGHDPHLRAARRDHGSLPREVRHPAQRYPPVADRGRADAHPGRRKGNALGDGVGNHHQDPELHQPHPHARGAGDLAPAPDAEASAPARGDHLRDQPALSQRDPPALPGR
jgi:hypothetical protein